MTPSTNNPMHGNLTTAAWIFGGALVVASLVLVIGIFFSVNMAMDRADAIARDHALTLERAGVTASDTVRETTEAAIDRMATLVIDDVLVAVEGHGGAIESAGATLREAFEQPLAVNVDTADDAPMSVQLARPLQLQQPLVIEGTEGVNQALPVQVSVFE